MFKKEISIICENYWNKHVRKIREFTYNKNNNGPSI